MESTLKSSHAIRNFLFLGMIFLFAMFAVPSNAMLLNVSDRNVIQEIRNVSRYTIGNYVNMSNISFVQPELRINITSGNGTNYNFSVFVDGVPTPSFNITNNTAVYFNISTRLANGTHSILVQFNSSEDENAKRNSSNITFTVDDTPSVFQAFSAGTVGTTLNATNTSDTTPEIVVNLTDNEFTTLNVSVYISGTFDGTFLATNNTLQRYNLSARVNSTIRVRFEANDSAQNLANTSLLTLSVDDTRPVASVSYLTVNATNTSDTTPGIIVNITDNFFTVDINATIFVNGAYNGSSLLSANATNVTINTSAVRNGTFLIQVQVTDPSGNSQNSTGITITVDDTPPVFQAFASGNGATNNASNISDTTPEILFNLTDNGFTAITYNLYVSGTYAASPVAVNNTIGRVNLTALPQNTSYFIRLEANDSAGNLANASILTLYLYDGKPVVNILSFPVNMTNSTNTTQIIIFNITRTGNLSAGASALNYTIFIDGTQNGTSVLVGNDTNITSLMTTFYNGTHFVWVQAIDPAGNRGNSTIYTITTDAEAPYAVISSPVNATNTTDVTPEIVFTVVDNSSAFSSVLNYTIFVDGAVNGQTGITSNGTATRVNLTALANASHNITIQVSDFLNNTRNSTAHKIVTETNAPGTTLSFSPATVYKGNAVTVSCSASDTVSGTNSSSSRLTVTKPNGIVVTMSGCGTDFTDTTAGGTYTITYTVADFAGNTATATTTFVSNDPGGSSSSSGGGGGGTAAPSTPSTTASKTIIVDAFTPDKPNVVKLTSENIGFKEISVDIANKVNAVEIKVVKTDSAPAEVTKAVEGKVYQYIEIKHDKLKDDNIKSAKVKFTVTKKWAADNNVAKENVVLKRFKDGTWTDMKTTLSTESSAEITYEAELPGLSVFAIGEAVPTAAAQQPAEQPSQETQQPSQQPTTPSAPSTPSSPGQPAAAYGNEMMYYAAGGVILILIVAYFWVKATKVGRARRKK
ncbi:MAG: PGF-pre-PGF domain-containing protein [Candidatus Aenigmarchaeota archaeon]|nr:PGF-pre-PGF domain-containing protein [Candidatus Aenigmarchaeota archaeon]